MIHAKADLPKDILLRIPRSILGHAPLERIYGTTRRGTINAIVQCHQVFRQRAAA